MPIRASNHGREQLRSLIQSDAEATSHSSRPCLRASGFYRVAL